MRRSIGFVATFLCLTAAVQSADVDDLTKKLKDKDPDVRRAAARALGDAGKEAKEAVPALAAALKDADFFVRRFSALALGSIGPDAAAAAPDLAAMFTNIRERKEGQLAAVEALGKIGGEAGAESMAKSLKVPQMEFVVRQKVIEMLGKMGPAAKVAVPALTDEYTRKGWPKGKPMPPQEEDLRPAAAEALGAIATSEDKAVVDALEPITKDEKVGNDNPMKKAAAEALKKIAERK